MDKSIYNSARQGNLSDITTYQAGAMQAAADRALQKYCDHVLKPYGITKMQWLIVGTILDTGPAGTRITDVAYRLDTTISYLTTTINLLESKSILTRSNNDSDSRSKLIAVHPDFVARCSEIEARLRHALRKSIYADIDPDEFRIYIKVLSQLSNIEKLT